MDYRISSDKSKLDVAAIHDYLCNKSYWAKGRSLESVKKSIDNSICFALYDAEDHMLGFARVVSDKIVFAYLMDLFIFEEHQGNKLGMKLVKHIVEHPDLQVRLWFLATEDAHPLYEKFGFACLPDPDRYLFKRDKNRF